MLGRDEEGSSTSQDDYLCGHVTRVLLGNFILLGFGLHPFVRACNEMLRGQLAYSLQQ